MKIIGLLLALLLVGWLLSEQLGLISPATQAVSHDENYVPRVPTTPQQLEAFDNDINQFVTDSAVQRAQDLEQNQ